MDLVQQLRERNKSSDLGDNLLLEAADAMEQMHAALVLAEDVLSRAPHSSRLWHNGMHPQTGIDRIRDAIKRLANPT